MEPTWEEVVRRAQRRDAEAFARLIARHERTALALAYGLLADPNAAGDVVQEAFVRAWERLADLKEPALGSLRDLRRASMAMFRTMPQSQGAKRAGSLRSASRSHARTNAS